MTVVFAHAQTRAALTNIYAYQGALPRRGEWLTLLDPGLDKQWIDARFHVDEVQWAVRYGDLHATVYLTPAPA